MKFWLRKHIHFIVFFCFFSIITFSVQGNPAVPIYTEIKAPGISWQHARDSAIALGGHLVTITSAQEEQNLIEIVKTGVWWIGANDEASEGDWQWVTGEPWGFTHWIAGEPNNVDNEDHAIWFASGNYGWADVNGYADSGFILETNPSGPYPKHIRVFDSIGIAVITPTPTISWEYIGSSSPQALYEIEIGTDSNWAIAEVWDTGPIASSDTSVVYTGTPLSQQQYYLRVRLNDGIEWGPWNQRSFYVFPANKHFYEFILPNKTWEQARDSAILAGGHLATITNPGEKPFDSILFGTMFAHTNGAMIDRAYIGGQYVWLDTVQWEWLTSEPWGYTNWETGEPNYFSNSMLTMTYRGKWRVDEGIDSLPFIIEYDTDWGITDFALDRQLNINRSVTSHNPLFSWKVSLDTIPISQYQVQVSKSANWSTNIYWDSGPVSSTDTEAIYAGSPLSDGTVYFARTRTFNTVRLWTPWKIGIFYTNYPPTPPIVDTAIQVIAELNPRLMVGNSTNAGLPLDYRFELYRDSLLTQLQDSASGIHQGSGAGPGVTAWTVPTPLQLDTQYWWRCKSYNASETSEWSITGRFLVTFNNHKPSIPYIQFTNDTTMYEMLPTIHWLKSNDFDLNDTIYYQIEAYKFPEFTFLLRADSLVDTSYTFTDSLEYGSRYFVYVYAIDRTLLTSVDSKPLWVWTLGDVNHSHSCNVIDLNYMVYYFFSSGSPAEPVQTGDINGDCQINILDIVYMVSYLFQSGPIPKVGCVP